MNKKTKTKVLFAGKTFFIFPRKLGAWILSNDEDERDKGKVLFTLMANCYHHDGKTRFNKILYECKEGECITSFRELEAQCKVHRNKIQRFLVELSKEEILTIEKLAVGSRIRLNFYLEFLEMVKSHAKKPEFIPCLPEESGITEEELRLTQLALEREMKAAGITVE